jgi:hypothetical protein
MFYAFTIECLSDFIIPEGLLGSYFELASKHNCQAQICHNKDNLTYTGKLEDIKTLGLVVHYHEGAFCSFNEDEFLEVVYPV